MSEEKPEPQDTMVLMANIRTSGETVTFRASMDSLPQVLEVVEKFIRACGYCPEGVLDFVKDE